MHFGILGAGETAFFIKEALEKKGQTVSFYVDRTPPLPSFAKALPPLLTGGWGLHFNPRLFGEEIEALLPASEPFLGSYVTKLRKRGLRIYPEGDIFKASQNFIYQRRLFSRLRLPIPFCCVLPAFDPQSVLGQFRFPLRLLDDRLGEGADMGTRVDSSRAFVKAFVDSQKKGTRDIMAEQIYPAKKSYILGIYRNAAGVCSYLPPAEIAGISGFLEVSVLQKDFDPLLEETMRKWAKKIGGLLNLKGFLSVEFYVLEEGKILVSRIFPSLHKAYVGSRCFWREDAYDLLAQSFLEKDYTFSVRLKEGLEAEKTLGAVTLHLFMYQGAAAVLKEMETHFQTREWAVYGSSRSLEAQYRRQQEKNLPKEESLMAAGHITLVHETPDILKQQMQIIRQYYYTDDAQKKLRLLRHYQHLRAQWVA